MNKLKVASAKLVTDVTVSKLTYAYTRWCALMECHALFRSDLNKQLIAHEESMGKIINSMSMNIYGNYMKYYGTELIQFTIQHPFKSMEAWKRIAKKLKQQKHINKTELLQLLAAMLPKYNDMEITWEAAITQLTPAKSKINQGMINLENGMHRSVCDFLSQLSNNVRFENCICFL